MNAASGGYQGTNTGFGDGVHQPKGGYREHREVSTNARPAGGDLGSSDLAPLLAAMQRAGRLGGAPRR